MDNATTVFVTKQQSSSSYGCGWGRHSNGGRGCQTQENVKFFNVMPQQFTPRPHPHLLSILGPPSISYPAPYSSFQPSNATIYNQHCYKPNHTACEFPSLNF
ncbi:hypothetical protein HAX54_052949 [Datura stramonium]|uniref:Uncharacterized protein n=1 Tax=Datura stramonium TaxID=4076 RepID=A0ABS8T0B6_DATST|nr:hypothetical protein [Datura stramonium]